MWRAWMLWNYSSLEYCLYIGPDCILCPLKWHFSWFCTHFYWSFQNFLYVSWWPGLPSRVLFHLFRILTRMIFLYKAAAHPYSHSWNILTGGGFCCLPEPKLRCLMFCLPLVPGGITLFGGQPTKRPNLLIPHTSAVEYFLRKWFVCS